MTDYIVIVIIVVIVLLALRSSLKHFRGEGECCGGGTYKARKKKLGSVAAKRTVKVDGMTCQHCVNRVMEAINSMDGASAEVHLRRGLVVVSMETPMEDETIRNAIEKAGYTVLGFQ